MHRPWFQRNIRLLLGLLAWVAPGVSLLGATLQIHAAASLTDALRQMAAVYEKDSGDRLQFNLGASSFLARQIEEGAPGDLFLSADDGLMDRLAKKNLIVEGTRTALLGNTLTVVVPGDAKQFPSNAQSLVQVKRLALADPRTVPAGLYAKAYLECQGVWPALARRVVPTDNVRGALAAVESGNVDAAIVYRTDAAISRQVRVAFQIPASDAPAIVYPVALLRSSAAPERARACLTFLKSPAAAAIFRAHGFIVREQSEP